MPDRPFAPLSLVVLLIAAFVPFAFPARGQTPAPSPDTTPPSRRRVVITAFEPFDGRTENNSSRIAAAMSAHPELFSGIELTVCTLPVVFDEAAARAEACIGRLADKPDLVLSLGEVGCKVQLETSAGNEDHSPGFPDNAGNVRSHRTIVPGGPARLGYDLPVQAMFCALSPEERTLVDVSNSMSYVCNNTAYLLATKLRGTGIPFGFVHVPTTESRCGAANDPFRNAQLIAHLLAGALADQAGSRGEAYALPHCSNVNRLPTSLEELGRAADSIAEAERGASCEKEFLDRLKELMR